MGSDDSFHYTEACNEARRPKIRAVKPMAFHSGLPASPSFATSLGPRSPLRNLTQFLQPMRDGDQAAVLAHFLDSIQPQTVGHVYSVVLASSEFLPHPLGILSSLAQVDRRQELRLPPSGLMHLTER